MKLWIKTFKNEKIQLNELVLCMQPLSVDSLLNILMDLKDKFDLSLPIITQTNINNLINFNHTKFKQTDFLESIDFDYMEISKILK